jgi:hypothetical protein
LQVLAVPKISTRDTVFKTTNHQGHSVDVPIPAGTRLSVNIVGLHHNRKHLLRHLARPMLIIEIGQRDIGRIPWCSTPKGFSGNITRTRSFPLLLEHVRALAGGMCLDERLLINLVDMNHRFAEVEILAALCLMVLHYDIEVTEDPEYEGETFEERKARVLNARMHVITLAAKKIPLTFKRRT